MEDGYLIVPTGYGIGVEPDEDFLKAVTVESVTIK
jgi:L-alanine-DL-glutamate epimerase-like enolase superfamily enzyme